MVPVNNMLNMQNYLRKIKAGPATLHQYTPWPITAEEGRGHAGSDSNDRPQEQHVINNPQPIGQACHMVQNIQHIHMFRLYFASIYSEDFHTNCGQKTSLQLGGASAIGFRSFLSVILLQRIMGQCSFSKFKLLVLPSKLAI